MASTREEATAPAAERPTGPLRWARGRLGGRLPVLAVAGLLAAGAVGLVLVRGGAGTVAEAPAAAPARRGGAPCRPDPLARVPHPTRFVVVAGCASVSGTVRQARRDPADGELNLLVAVDPAYARFVPAGNRGLLRVAVVPPDVPAVTVPAVGRHATFHGAWVLDRNQGHQVAMHPVWKIEVTGGAAPPAAGRPLQIRLAAPRSVPVGGALDVVVKVFSGAGAARRPEPEANLFFEIRRGDGRGVQWKAAATNALGLARVTLVALEHPGPFRLWLYVDKPGGSAVVSAPVRVRRR